MLPIQIMTFNFARFGVQFLQMTRSSSRKLAAALIVIGVALLLVGRGSPRAVGHYAAEAAIQVIKPPSDSPSTSELLRRECSILESTALLDGVISNLNLTVKWATSEGQPSISRLRHRLSSSLEVIPNDPSEQVRVRVSGRDKQEAEDIANSVLRVYQEVRRSSLRQSKPRDIVALEDQLEEIEPRLKLAIETMERLRKELNLNDFYTPPKPEPTLLDRINDGKEDEERDTGTSSLYSYDPVPKNETPEQAKRRIYLRSRRIADVLSLRKERAEMRLEVLRARSSTPESATVQVVQSPEAIPQKSIRRSTGNKGWAVAGWTFIFVGAISLLTSGRTRSTSI